MDTTNAILHWVIDKITPGDVLTFGSIVFAVVSLILQNLKSLEVQRIELYQRLETSSIDVFKFEAEHSEILEKFQDMEIDEKKFDDSFAPLQAKFGSMRAFVQIRPQIEAGAELLDAEELKAARERYEQERLIARKLYEQTVNLFEMATRFRNKRIIEPEVFGSWVIWFYDILSQWSFRDHWPDLKQNYTPDLRAVFNRFVAEFDPAEDNNTRKHRFFNHVAQITHCPIIRDWLVKLDAEDRALAARSKHAHAAPVAP